MSKKYRLTQNNIEYQGKKLYQIQALRNIRSIDIKKGDLGGYVESENNLSQEGDCWVHYAEDKHYGSDYGIICGNASVIENAQLYLRVIISDNAQISGNVVLRGSLGNFGILILENAKIQDKVNISSFPNSRIWISDNALISGNADIWSDNFLKGISIFGNAKIYQNAVIREGCEINQYAEVFGRAWVSDSKISGNAKVFGNSWVDLGSKIADSVQIYDDTYIRGSSIKGNAQIFDKSYIEQSVISGNSQIYNKAIIDRSIINENVEIFGDASVQNVDFFGKNAKISSETDYLHISLVGRHHYPITFYRTQSDDIAVAFTDEFADELIDINLSLSEFIDYVQKHYNKKELEEFNLLIALAESRILSKAINAGETE